MFIHLQYIYLYDKTCTFFHIHIAASGDMLQGYARFDCVNVDNQKQKDGYMFCYQSLSNIYVDVIAVNCPNLSIPTQGGCGGVSEALARDGSNEVEPKLDTETSPSGSSHGFGNLSGRLCHSKWWASSLL